jgi:rhamnose transport system permease protein
MTAERRALDHSYAFADRSEVQPARRRWLRLLQNRALGVGIFLALLALFFAGLAPNFATVANVNTIVLNATILVVVACAEAIVVITRNYDLSVGSNVALASYVGLDVIRLFPQAGPILILVPVAIGTLCGVVNGFLVAYGRLPSVIATLGTLSIFRGLAFVYANGRQINAQDLPAWVGGTASSHVLGVSTLVLVALAVVAVAAFMLAQLRFGRQIYAIGSNPEAAVFYGLNARAVIFRAYVVSGTLTGLAAYLFAARSSWIVPYLAQGLELTALAAVVIGGVSVLGGSGTVIGAAIGALTLATLDNGLILLGASEFARQFIQGSAIVIAVVVDAVIQRRIRGLLKSLRRRRF